jgi:hypothetical protein
MGWEEKKLLSSDLQGMTGPERAQEHGPRNAGIQREMDEIPNGISHPRWRDSSDDPSNASRLRNLWPAGVFPSDALVSTIRHCSERC